ncbi:MAG: hypothetical protein J1E80_08835 [Desulfovibrionaceae bacterium]|nr:hypothetical protein [Desulfovibrionaceae bacterium]
MPLKLWGLGLLILLCQMGTAHAAWRDLSVLNGAITLSAPEDFGPMPAHLRPMPYPGIERPLVMLSDPDGQVTLSVNHTRAEVEGTIQTIRKTMSPVLHQSCQQALWLRDEVEKVNGQLYAVFEYVAPENGAATHTILYVTRLRETLLILTFKAPAQGNPLWIQTGRTMMASLRLR